MFYIIFSFCRLAISTAALDMTCGQYSVHVLPPAQIKKKGLAKAMESLP